MKPFFYGAFHSGCVPSVQSRSAAGRSPAELGFSVAGIGHIPLFFHVRDATKNTARPRSWTNIPETGPLQGAILTLWGVPAAAEPRPRTRRHAGQKEVSRTAKFCQPMVDVEAGVEEQSSCPSDAPAKPFLTLPSELSSPSEPISAVATATPGRARASPAARTDLPERLARRPTRSPAANSSPSPPRSTLAPETTQAGAPSGYTVELHMPQNEDPSGAGDAGPARRGREPAGGRRRSRRRSRTACRAARPAQFEPGARSAVGVVSAAVADRDGEDHDAAAVEPAGRRRSSWASRNALRARRRRAGRQADPPAAAGAGLGRDGQARRRASIDQSHGPADGDASTKAPQLPFEDVKLTLDGGPNAPLANPSTCGTPLAASS